MVDLITSADADGDRVSGTIEEMVKILERDYFLKNPQPSDVFSQSDFYGDLDAYYIINEIKNLGEDYEPSVLVELVANYFTEELTVADRAEYFLRLLVWKI